MKYPDDSLQSVILPSDWWVKNTENKLCRGALIYAFVPLHWLNKKGCNNNNSEEPIESVLKEIAMSKAGKSHKKKKNEDRS